MFIDGIKIVSGLKNFSLEYGVNVILKCRQVICWWKKILCYFQLLIYHNIS